MLETILKKCIKKEELTDEEIKHLLTRKEKKDVDRIFETARQIRKNEFGNKVFLYGFVYFSTYCKNNCSFCYFRRDNNIPLRYRKDIDEVVETAKALKESGVHLIDLTTGDDPYYTEYPERLAEIVRQVKKATGLGVMVSPGVLDRNGIDFIADAGADWYALYHETHNENLFSRLRLEQSYSQRFNAKKYALSAGLLIEEGLLVGVGDSVEDRVDSFKRMKELNASQVRAMTFIKQEGAPLEGEECNFDRELMTIAVMRLLFPYALIPASLDVEGLKGLESRLMAGANVVTSIIPPQKGYAGVANSVQDIDEGYRTVNGITETLKKCEVQSATVTEYLEWIKQRKKVACIEKIGD